MDRSSANYKTRAVVSCALCTSLRAFTRRSHGSDSFRPSAKSSLFRSGEGQSSCQREGRWCDSYLQGYELQEIWVWMCVSKFLDCEFNGATLARRFEGRVIYEECKFSRRDSMQFGKSDVA